MVKSTQNDVTPKFDDQRKQDAAIISNSFSSLESSACTRAALLSFRCDSTGTVTTAIGTSDDFATSVAIQSDGKIMVAGYTWNGSIRLSICRRWFGRRQLS